MVPELTPHVERLHRVLLDEIVKTKPDYLRAPFTVAEIYQILVPYRTHRDAIGVEMNGDYEDAILRLLAGAGDLLVLESEPAMASLRQELTSNNPNTGVFREYGDARVHLNPATIGNRDIPSSALRGSPEAAAGNPEDRSAGRDDLGQQAARPSPGPERDKAQQAEYHVEPGSDADDLDAAEPEAWPLEAFGGEEPGDAEPTEPAPMTETSSLPDVEARVASTPPALRCLWCGDGLPDGRHVNFCPHCGTSTSLRPCRDCGEEMELSWQFCVMCGAASADGVDA